MPIVLGDPEEVLHLMEDEKPDLVLLDLMLPVTDDIELMKDVLTIADVPIIFLSAYGQEQLIVRLSTCVPRITSSSPSHRLSGREN